MVTVQKQLRVELVAQVAEPGRPAATKAELEERFPVNTPVGRMGQSNLMFPLQALQQAAAWGPKLINEMQVLVASALNELIEQVCRQAGCRPAHIDDVQGGTSFNNSISQLFWFDPNL